MTIPQCTQVIEVQFNISMHCNACERQVAKTISKIKGVEKFITDMTRNRVTVTGQFCPDKVLKKLKKKTGKKVEIVKLEREDGDEQEKDEEEETTLNRDELNHGTNLDNFSMLHDGCNESALFTMFNDENVNACSTM